MTQHVDRIPPLELTLEDAVRVTVSGTQRWALVLGLVHAGDEVVVTCAGLDRALVLPARVPVVVLRGAMPEADDIDVEDAMGHWYAGDVDAATASALAAERAKVRTTAQPPASGAPRMSRDPSLVGIYGGDLDHIIDALGHGDADPAARALRATLQRALAEAAAQQEHVPQPGEPETDAITEAVEARMAGWYAGDVDFVAEHKDEHPDPSQEAAPQRNGR
ncbi:MAG TPA: hypothetical protein VF143_12930 [Candidatus Nanopelagicales bacterium]